MTPHQIAHELVRQIAADAGIHNAAALLYGRPCRFYLDDDADDAGDGNPHVVATPESGSGGRGADDEATVLVVVSARDPEGRSCVIEPDDEPPGEVKVPPTARTFDEFAAVVLAAVERANPGSIYQGYEAEWDFRSLYPLRYVVFSVRYSSINSF